MTPPTLVFCDEGGAAAEAITDTGYVYHEIQVLFSVTKFQNTLFSYGLLQSAPTICCILKARGLHGSSKYSRMGTSYVKF